MSNRPHLFSNRWRITALAATGFIWVRYSLVIKPINYSLAAVNFGVGCTGLTQLARIYMHKQEEKQKLESAEKVQQQTA